MFPSRPGGKQGAHLKTLPESSCDFWSHMQAAHCGRSSRFIPDLVFIPSSDVLPGSCWLNPTRSQRAKKPTDTVVRTDQPSQGKARWRRMEGGCGMRGEQTISKLFIYTWMTDILSQPPVFMSAFPLDSDPATITSTVSALGKGRGQRSLLGSGFWINELIREWHRWEQQEHNWCSWMVFNFYF